MRILHVHKYYHARDGVGRYLFDLMRLLEGAGHVTAAFAMHDPRNAPSVWEQYFVSELDTSHVGKGFGILQQLCRAWWSKEAEQKMTEMLRVFKPDVVHVHNVYTHLSPSVLRPCQKLGIPVVMTVHDFALMSANYALWDHNRVLELDEVGIWQTAKTRFVKGSFFATLALESIFTLQKYFKLYDRAIVKYITLSTFMKDALVFSGYTKEKIVTIPPPAGPLLHEYTLSRPRKKDSVLFAGRLEEYKGISLYLDLAERFPEVTFLVAGTGRCEALVHERMVKQKNISYLGFLPAERLWEEMASVQAVIVPSLWYEPFGLVALEAASLGTPVLVSDRGGLPEMVQAGKCGRVFPVGNVDIAEKKLREFFDDQTWNAMHDSAIKFTQAHYSPQVFLTNILKTYESVLHE